MSTAHSSPRPSHTATATKFVLNIAPVKFDDAEVRVGVLPYESGEQLALLRSTHGSTHVFRRVEGTRIEAVAFVSPAPDVGDTFKTVKLKHDLGLTAALIRNAIIGHLHGLPRKVFDYRPITFLADESRENLLQQALPRGTACPDWLSVCPLYDADVRVFHFDRQDPFVGMCLNVCTRRRITRSCHGLLADGFRIDGYYVGRLLPSTDQRIQPFFRLAGRVERVVGITTVFSGDGNYCVHTLSRAVSFENYAAELLHSLKSTIERLSRSMNWQPKEHVRLVFHAFKPLKEAEEEAVKALIATLGDYDVEYAFLHVVEDHPMLLFDEAQKGEPAYDGRGGVKGVFALTRGRFLRLSGHEVLITLTGAREVKQASDGLPRPILLRLGRGSTFNDMTYLTRQVNTFACHSWRSYFPSPLPVTILYSDLIARLLGHLSTLLQWNPALMLGRIGETRWFL